MTRYVQPNKGILVRLSKEAHSAIEEMAEERRWSKAAVLAYITEEYFQLSRDPIKRKR